MSSDKNKNDLQEPLNVANDLRFEKAQRRLRAIADSAYYSALQSVEERLHSDTVDEPEIDVNFLVTITEKFNVSCSC